MNRMRATYSVIRYVPSVTREEFVNVGVLLICPQVGFQAMRTLHGFGEGSRIKSFEQTDGLFVRHAMTKLRDALEDKSINATLMKPEADASLEPKDLQNLFEMYQVNNVQFSPPRSVATTEPAVTLEELFQDFVGAAPRSTAPKTVTRTVIRDKAHKEFSQLGLFQLGLQEEWEVPTRTRPKVDFAYLNHVWHSYQAISFTAHEQALTNAVNAYRQTARDAREDSNLPENVRDTKFTVLAHQSTSASVRVRNLIEALEFDRIVVADHRDAADIAKDIERDLREHQPIKPVQAALN